MVSIIELAFILLIAHTVSLVFIFRVLRRQYQLMRLPIDKHLQGFRKVLFLLSCAIFLGNIVPIIIDTLTLFVDTERPSELHTISVVYACSNALTAMASALLIWLLYKIAGQDEKDDE